MRIAGGAVLTCHDRRWISKRHVAELQRSTSGGGGQGRATTIADGGRFGVQQHDDARHRRGSALKQVGGPAKRDERPGEHTEIDAKGDIPTDRDLTSDQQSAANPHGDSATETSQQGESGIHQAIERGQPHVGGEVGFAHHVEARRLGRLLTVRADHAHPREVFLCACGELAELRLYRFEARVDEPSQAQHEEGQADHR